MNTVQLAKEDIIDFKWRFKDELQFEDIQQWYDIAQTDVSDNMLIMGIVEVNGERTSVVTFEQKSETETHEDVLYVHKTGNTVYTTPGKERNGISELCENMTLKVLERFSGGKRVSLTVA